MSVYFTQKVIARAKDTGVESNKITGKEGKTLLGKAGMGYGRCGP